MPDKTLLFRRLELKDFSAMYKLEKLCFALPWSEQQCYEVFAQPAFAAFGLFASEQLTAYLSLYYFEHEMEILNLAVHPDKRRQGLGQMLLTKLLQYSQRLSVRKICLEVRVGNRAALALYHKCGFVLTGRRRHYYPDTGEDALILQVHLKKNYNHA